jgi:hypothetical protein
LKVGSAVMIENRPLPQVAHKNEPNTSVECEIMQISAGL